MTAPLAHTRHEANLFIDVTPCECGELRLPRVATSFSWPDGSPGVRYAGTCPNCGRERIFDFRLPVVSEDVPADGEVIFGLRSVPSELLDLGQWVAVAEAYAGAVPADAADLTGEQRDLARLRLMAAIGAILEALKFVRHHTGEGLTESAFWTEMGRATYAQDPQRFTAFSLEMLEREYEQRLRATDGPEELAKMRVDPERVQRMLDEADIKRAWKKRHGIGETTPTANGTETRKATPAQNRELERDLRRRRGLDVITGGDPDDAVSGLMAFESLLEDVRAQWRQDSTEAQSRIDLAYAAYLAWRDRHGIEDSAWAHVLMSRDPRTDAWSVRDVPLPAAELVWEMVREGRRAAGMPVGDE